MPIDVTNFQPLYLAKAKQIVFDRLVDAVGTIESIDKWTADPGSNSFLGYLPPCFDVWGITFGGGGRVEHTWNMKPPAELHINADIEGNFRTMDAADEVGMRLLSGMAMRWVNEAGEEVDHAQPHIIQTFRMRQGGNIDTFLDPRPISNEGVRNPETAKMEPCLVWVLKIGCELVFNTWKQT